MSNHPMKPNPDHAAYVAIILSLLSTGLALAALGAVLTVGVR